MTTPGMPPLLTVPYVGTAEFIADPTFLDTNNIVEGGDPAQQTAELYNQLLKASRWADNFTRGAGGSLQAHAVVENTTARVDKYGQIWVHPRENPIRSITALSYGVDLSDMTSITSFGYGTNTYNGSSPTQAWVVDQRGIVVALTGLNTRWSGMLQFGPSAAPATEVYVQLEYTTGWGNSQIVTATQGQSQITLSNTEGFQIAATSIAGNPYGGSIARIWDPSLEEAVTVTAINPTTGVVTLASALLNSHTTAGVQCSEFPAEIRQAVIQYACGLLLRENAQNDMPFPGSPGPAARRSANRGVAGGLISEAERLLCPYKRVR